MFEWLQRLIGGPATAPQAQAEAEAAPAPDPVPAAPPVPAAAAPARAAQAPADVSFDQRDRINTIWNNWLFDTPADGESSLDINPVETQVLDQLTTILNSQQSGAAMVRRLPGLIPQLLQSLRSDNFSGAQLSKLISNDVVLLSAVIRMANTSFRGTGTAITSVEHAVILIGQEGLRHIITTVAFRPIIDMNSGQYTRHLAPRMWDQSERCGVANRLLAEAAGVDPFEAFLAGVVQNVGLIVTLRLMDQVAKGEKELGSEMFCARLVRDARTLTNSIGKEWTFPDSVITAIAEQAGVKKGAAMSPLGGLLSLSDYLSKLRVLAEAGVIDEADPRLFEGLGAPALACYRALDAVGEDEAPPQALAGQ
jgi:HD-like signal output (HDOD) protein